LQKPFVTNAQIPVFLGGGHNFVISSQSGDDPHLRKKKIQSNLATT
jgi:hypothetical protein